MFIRNRGILLMLGGLLLLAATAAPLVVRSALQELGRQNQQVTADWQTIEAEGLRLRLPPSWFEITSEGRVLGLDIGHVVAPSCTENSDEGCQAAGAPPLELRWQIERVENRSTPEGDEIRAHLVDRGFSSRPASLGGLPGTLFTATDDYGGVDQVLVLEHGGVYYRFWLSEGLSTASSGELGPLILGTIELTPSTAPSPWGVPMPAVGLELYLPLLSASGQHTRTPQLATLAEPDVPVTPQSAGLAVTVFVNPNAIANYAEAYGEPPGPLGWPNSDNCYVFTDIANTSPNCFKTSFQNVGRDGAHFIDCALKAGGLTLACNGDPGNPYVGMASLYNALTGLPHRIVSSAEARRGDIFVLRRQSDGGACWGGIILGRDNNGVLRAATHSSDSLDTNPEAAACVDADDQPQAVIRTYLRLNSDEQPPVAHFVSPATGYVAPGALTLSYDATDLPEGDSSGVASFAITRTIEGTSPELLDDDATSRELTLFFDTPCRSVTFSLSAIDNAGNRSQEVSLKLDVGIWGDADKDNDVDDADLAAAEAAWGRQRGDAGFLSALDVNADDRIDATDLLWIERHRGDRCS